MIALVMMGVFAAGAIAAHMVWLRGYVPWARAATVICLLGLMVVAAAHMGLLNAFVPRRGEGPAYEIPDDEVMRQLGLALKGVLPQHAKMIVFIPGLSGGAGHAQAWREALESAVGSPVNILAFAAPKVETDVARLSYPGRSSAFSQVLDQYPDVDAWISLTGLPEDLPRVSSYKRHPPPLVAAYVGSMPMDPRVWARYLKTQQVAVIVTSDRQHHLAAYTHENFADLAATANQR